MTASPQIELAPATPRSHRIRADLVELVLAALLIALVTGAWLAFFTFVPLDFTPPRPG